MATFQGSYNPAFAGDKPTLDITLFGDNVFQRAEQTDSRIYNLFDREILTNGDSIWLKDMVEYSGETDDGTESGTPPWRASDGSTGLLQRTNRYEKQHHRYSVFEQRLLNAEEWYFSELIERKDLARTNIDINGNITRKASNKFAQKRDRVCVQAMNAAVTVYQKSTAGNTLNSTSTRTLASENNVISDGSEGLTIAKLRDALLRITKNDVPSEGLYFIGTVYQRDNLLADSKIQSIDFNEIKAMVNGEVNKYMGFEFLWYGTKNDILDKAGDVRTCFAFHRDAITVGIAEEMFKRMTEKDQLHYLMEIYLSMEIGAVRRSEEHVVQVDCVEQV
jgi:hypothetical protein